jgi:hypothetical protein
MSVCSACGGATKMLSGISKKNGKPWSGNGCLNPACRNIDFNRSYSAPVSASSAKTTVITQKPVQQKMDELINTDVLKGAIKLAMHTCKPEGETAGVIMIAEVDAYYRSLLNILKNEEKF